MRTAKTILTVIQERGKQHKPIEMCIRDRVAALLRDGRTRLTGCYSMKTGKVYDATVMLDASEKERVRFLLSFDKPGKERKCV